jgi:hypothetical protein
LVRTSWTTLVMVGLSSITRIRSPAMSVYASLRGTRREGSHRMSSHIDQQSNAS